ncbi:hypothetical protein [Rhizobium azibense]|uniref:hypothetical protein n=1 Tax=Rhizobium azibense TaxID=1136135 RepID=UPI0014053B24|nr:hypothetical protein [Rhizobium azibense]
MANGTRRTQTEREEVDRSLVIGVVRSFKENTLGKRGVARIGNAVDFTCGTKGPCLLDLCLDFVDQGLALTLIAVKLLVQFLLPRFHICSGHVPLPWRFTSQCASRARAARLGYYFTFCMTALLNITLG